MDGRVGGGGLWICGRGWVVVRNGMGWMAGGWEGGGLLVGGTTWVAGGWLGMGGRLRSVEH